MNPPNRKDSWFVAAAVAAALVVLAVGFRELGPPSHQRDINADISRVADLRTIAHRLQTTVTLGSRVTLADLARNEGLRISDPVTHAAYEYLPGSGTAYELCATFATRSSPGDELYVPPNSFWRHAAGRQCFHLDASANTPW